MEGKGSNQAMSAKDQTGELVALEDALNRLAEVLKISPETVARDWRMARAAWLLRELQCGEQQ